MDIRIHNPNEIIESANFEMDTPSCSSIFINTKERWIEPDATSSIFNDVKYDYMYALQFDFYPENESVDYDYVLFVSETEKEEKALSRLRFSLHDKDQLWYVLLASKVFMGKRHKQQA